MKEHEQKHSQHNNSKHHDHRKHHEHMIEDFQRRFWFSLILTLPILILSPLIQDILGYRLIFRFDNYLLFGLSSLVYFYGGWPFLTGLIDELKKKQPGMMTLIGVAITVAYGYSAAITFGLEGKPFYWELATLIDIMLLGHWIEMKSVVGASSALQKLVQLMPSEAHLIGDDGETKDVAVSEIKKGSLVLVKPGERIPADGIIIEGETYIDESMVTGESKPVEKKIDSKVISGTLNGNGSLKIKAEQVGEEAYLNRIIKMVREAQSEKSKTQHLADQVASWLTLISLSVGFITLISWLTLGRPFVFALERMVSVMVITCPHALGLAIPLVVAISTSVSAQRGLLIRNRTAFENSRKITLLVFDKTGTLTKGKFEVVRFGSLNNNYKASEILSLAGSLEAKSEHPLAASIMQKIKEEAIKISEVKNFKTITGKGIEGEVDNKKVKVVSPGFIKEKGFKIPDDIYKSEQETIVFVLIEDQLAGFIAMGDEIREESYEAIKILKKQNLKLFMMTGDNEKVARIVSDELNLDGYYAEVLPDQKLKKIKDFQSKGEFVAMTGDGINDAPALAKADVGIAVGSGTDVAAETADIILVNSNPMDIAKLIVYGKETYKKMIQNLIWATGYNIIAIPLAAGVLYNLGVIISPALGAVFMSISTVIVALNAQLLRKKIS
ncbi:MAG: copper-translocating P-type ATPase [Atribacterota bacterium]|nr:copper-translocating P-type ATPase [Atribacterota bacterium]MDD5497381.1 copper-translocating P-type ATPase [Atribacterota bacterium]